MRSSLLLLACVSANALQILRDAFGSSAPTRPRSPAARRVTDPPPDCAFAYDVWTHADTEFDEWAAASAPPSKSRVPAARDLARLARRAPLLFVAVAARVHSLLTADECDVFARPEKRPDVKPDSLPAAEYVIEILRVVALLIAMPVWVAFDTTAPFVRARAANAPTPLATLAT
jgi:hypothetical protein